MSVCCPSSSVFQNCCRNVFRSPCCNLVPVLRRAPVRWRSLSRLFVMTWGIYSNVSHMFWECVTRVYPMSSSTHYAPYDCINLWQSLSHMNAVRLMGPEGVLLQWIRPADRLGNAGDFRPRGLVRGLWKC